MPPLCLWLFHHSDTVTETTYGRNDLLLLTVPEALFAMAVGRHGKAEFMMAGVCDRSCSHHSKPGGRERLTGTRSYYNPQRLVPNDLLPPPGPSSYGFHSFQTSCRTSMWNMSSWEAFQIQGSSLYPQMTRGIGTNTEDTPRLFLPTVHLVITTVTKLWRTITHSWASNPNPGTPVPSFLS